MDCVDKNGDEKYSLKIRSKPLCETRFLQASQLGQQILLHADDSPCSHPHSDAQSIMAKYSSSSECKLGQSYQMVGSGVGVTPLAPGAEICTSSKHPE